MTDKEKNIRKLPHHNALDTMGSPELASDYFASSRKSSNAKHRILVMSHAHPDFSLGGGEIAAHNLFKGYRDNPNVENAWFLARADRGRGITGKISLRRPNEYLWEQSVHDWHRMKAVHQESVVIWFADLVSALKPSIVHTHHYAHLGLEYLRVTKQVDPNIKILMTLHEYMGICRNQGQMIKTDGFTLCSNSSPDDCAKCFPDISPEDFWLRKHYFMRYFDLVDQFLSPSEFLRQRYINWGILPDKITVIENCQSHLETLPPRSLAKGEKRNRFGFFGQITPYKGLDVLLEALTLMEDAESSEIVLEVHGANLELQPEDYQKKVKRLIDPLIFRGVVQWHGRYQPNELRSRMAGIDWVVVPSVWWENSPMVIQEGFSCGRPVLVSDIGGMKEKIRDWVDGRHVSTGNPTSWRAVFKRCISSIEEYNRLHKNIQRPLEHAYIAEQHINVIFLTCNRTQYLSLANNENQT